MDLENAGFSPIDFDDLNVGDVIIVDGVDFPEEKNFNNEIGTVIDSDTDNGKHFLIAFNNWFDGHYAEGREKCSEDNCWWFWYDNNSESDNIGDVTFYKNNLNIADIFSSLNESEDDWYMGIVSDFEKMKDLPLVEVTEDGEYYPTYLDAMLYLNITGLNTEKYQEIRFKERELTSDSDFRGLLEKELPFLGIPKNGDVCYFYEKEYKGSYAYIYKLKRVSDGKEFIIGGDGFNFIKENKINESTDDEYTWIDSLISQKENSLLLPDNLFLVKNHSILMKIIDITKTKPNENFNFEGVRDDGWRIIYRAFNHTPKKWEGEERLERNWAKHLIETGYWKPISKEEADKLFGNMSDYDIF